jgi:hypothetical protein
LRVLRSAAVECFSHQPDVLREIRRLPVVTFSCWTHQFLADRPQPEVEHVAETASDDVFVDLAGGVFSAEKDR